MLKVYFGEATPDVIYNTRVYFDNNYDEEWITDSLVKEIIKDVDKSTVVSGRCIDSPFLGSITPKDLSGGTKTLILALKEPSLFLNASTCGDNCAKWLLEIGKRVDVTVNLGHIMDFGDDEFEIYSINTNEILHNMWELFRVTDEYL